MDKTRTLTVSSVLPAPAAKVWARLQQLDTLRFIARPFAGFKPLDAAGPVWREGSVSRFGLRIFGLLPLGIHTIRVVRFDKPSLTVVTNEGNSAVPLWNHSIRLEALDTKNTRYTDEVTIGAGWATPMVYWWSLLFYRHRQKRWLRLLRIGQNP